MIKSIAIALVAAAAAALMFASIASGAILAMLLFYLAPLPLLVAALGWGPGGALIGGLIAGATLWASFGWAYAIGFLLTVALPAWWLGHLALLARNSDTSDPASLEWYPIGQLLLWMAACAVVMTLAALTTLGTDEATIREALRHGLSRLLAAQNAAPGAGAPTAETESSVVNLLVQIAPAAATTIAMATLVINTWIAGRIVLISGRLQRPWPDLAAVGYPVATLIALAAALAMSFAGGMMALIAQIVAAVLLAAYALAGLGVMHTVTGAMTGRGLWLGLLYLTLFLFGWPALGLIVLGLVDAVFGLRTRFRQRPPAATA